jgi:hypothetical protein
MGIKSRLHYRRTCEREIPIICTEETNPNKFKYRYNHGMYHTEHKSPKTFGKWDFRVLGKGVPPLAKFFPEISQGTEMNTGRKRYFALFNLRGQDSQSKVNSLHLPILPCMCNYADNLQRYLLRLQKFSVLFGYYQEDMHITNTRKCNNFAQNLNL